MASEKKKTGSVAKENNYQDLISDDPFEIFFNSYGEDILIPQTDNVSIEIPQFKDKSTTDIEIKRKKSKLTDLDFMNILKSNAHKKEIIKKPSFGICHQIKILTEKEVASFNMTLYKFPYEMNVKYENSTIFKQIYKIFVNSLKDAYKKYKEEKKEFYIKFNNDFLYFGSNLKITSGIKKILKVNDVSFEEKGDYIYVASDEICLVIDIILNLNLTRSSTMPFLLSTFPFENAMIYTAYLKKERTIKQEGVILSSYIFHGPIWVDKCKELLEHNHKVVW
ncbi:hypothetical protein NGRA_1245 [Nosema granulosis]|uniref:Uncharacterized protein n=1 Tax=Nosema granulosis TaxID=83296 RepID=A0A9P6GYV9_9MICR|nr:hypothetical protein NGRA_1245 [Nosema granulosis]